jgi:hypothetical protein
MDFNILAGQFAALAGFAALVAVLVNIFKLAGWVQDGQAPAWVLVINLVGFIAFIALKIFAPAVDLGQVDAVLAGIAQFLVFILGIVVQLFVSRVTHEKALRGLPLIGKSYSLDK